MTACIAEPAPDALHSEDGVAAAPPVEPPNRQPEPADGAISNTNTCRVACQQLADCGGCLLDDQERCVGLEACEATCFDDPVLLRQSLCILRRDSCDAKASCLVLLPTDTAFERRGP
jgi:coenzyme F420-reducing hydrogenase gamma subunit